MYDVARDEIPGGDHLKITVKVRNEKRNQMFEASLTLDSGRFEHRKASAERNPFRVRS
ncbi:hypothetical protein RFM40_13170 [Mesorhizobium sp. VK22E]|nr:hypothetical protein [Mesorhizobium sp. VK22E]